MTYGHQTRDPPPPPPENPSDERDGDSRSIQTNVFQLEDSVRATGLDRDKLQHKHKHEVSTKEVHCTLYTVQYVQAAAAGPRRRSLCDSLAHNSTYIEPVCHPQASNQLQCINSGYRQSQTHDASSKKFWGWIIDTFIDRNSSDCTI